jgi:predicted GIY-YIG superfamily endonuclease
MSEKKWYNYIIFDKSPSTKTYVGSTVNPTRRFRQHNGQIKGGAKYTRGGNWTPYIVLYDITHTKSSALSYEWHLKHSSRKILGSSKYKRKCGLEKFVSSKLISSSTNNYSHVLFVNSDYKFLTPFLTSQVAIIYLNKCEFTTQILENWVEKIKTVNSIRINI